MFSGHGPIGGPHQVRDRFTQQRIRFHAEQIRRNPIGKDHVVGVNENHFRDCLGEQTEKHVLGPGRQLGSLLRHTFEQAIDACGHVDELCRSTIHRQPGAGVGAGQKLMKLVFKTVNFAPLASPGPPGPQPAQRQNKGQPARQPQARHCRKARRQAHVGKPCRSVPAQTDAPATFDCGSRSIMHLEGVVPARTLKLLAPLRPLLAAWLLLGGACCCGLRALGHRSTRAKTLLLVAR